MCEYSHAMGNSNGTLAEYWDAIESTPGSRAASSGSSGTTASSRPCPTARPLGLRRRLRRPAQRRQLLRRTAWSGRTADRSRRCGSTERSRHRSGCPGDPDGPPGRVTLAQPPVLPRPGLAACRVRADRRRRRDAPGDARRCPRSPRGARPTVALPGWRGRRLPPAGEAWLTLALRRRPTRLPGRRQGSRSPAAAGAARGEPRRARHRSVRAAPSRPTPPPSSSTTRAASSIRCSRRRPR